MREIHHYGGTSEGTGGGGTEKFLLGSKQYFTQNSPLITHQKFQQKNKEQLLSFPLFT